MGSGQTLSVLNFGSLATVKRVKVSYWNAKQANDELNEIEKN